LEMIHPISTAVRDELRKRLLRQHRNNTRPNQSFHSQLLVGQQDRQIRQNPAIINRLNLVVFCTAVAHPAHQDCRTLYK
jgi:hypothetical protein